MFNVYIFYIHRTVCKLSDTACIGALFIRPFVRYVSVASFCSNWWAIVLPVAKIQRRIIDKTSRFFLSRFVSGLERFSNSLYLLCILFFFLTAKLWITRIVLGRLFDELFLVAIRGFWKFIVEEQWLQFFFIWIT